MQFKVTCYTLQVIRNMRTVAEILKKAREEKKLSLEEVHKITKIRLKYLEAIEKGDWKALPGIAYVRGFIKVYSDVLGLDPEKMMVLFRREYKDLEKTEVLPQSFKEDISENSFILTIKKIISKIFSI